MSDLTENQQKAQFEENLDWSLDRPPTPQNVAMFALLRAFVGTDPRCAPNISVYLASAAKSLGRIADALEKIAAQ